MFASTSIRNAGRINIKCNTVITNSKSYVSVENKMAKQIRNAVVRNLPIFAQIKIQSGNVLNWM